MNAEQYFPEGYLCDTLENKFSLKSRTSLTDAMNENKILEARTVMCDASHNLWVDLGCMNGKIPREEGAYGIIEGHVRDIALITRVNKPVCFMVTGFEQDAAGAPVAILSRRKPQLLCINNYVGRFIPGDVIPAKITHLEPFGAFADIGCGLPSLIPIDSISVSRIANPSDRFTVGCNILAVVKSVEAHGRVCLSHKELLGSWEENAERFSAGETVTGIIRSVESYGVFVELTPNLAGLAEPKEGVFPEQSASVYIKTIIPERMKVKLIIIGGGEKAATPPPEYFFTGRHMPRWVYSPECSSRVIESVFE